MLTTHQLIEPVELFKHLEPVKIANINGLREMFVVNILMFL
jgi:hypothetical protein